MYKRQNYDYSIGAYYLDNWDVGTLVLGTQEPTTSLSGSIPPSQFSIKQVEFSAEDLPAYVGILMKAQSTNAIGPFGVIVLE